MTAPTSPAHPCVPERPAMPCTEARDADGSKFYLDRNGRAWDSFSARRPELDAPPALEPSLSAREVGGVLAGMYRNTQAQIETLLDGDFKPSRKSITQRESECGAFQAIALALGPSVLAAFEKARVDRG